jgi:Homoserine acetyltransferase
VTAAAAHSLADDLPLGRFVTATGAVAGGLRLRYRVIGDVDAARDNGWILVFHALTGSAEVETWWGPLIGPGRALDTSRHAILSANLLGSCYGSTGPQEWAAEHDGPFPELTPADLAAAHVPLLEHLGVTRLALATGGSLGGMVTLEWGRRSPVPWTVSSSSPPPPRPRPRRSRGTPCSGWPSRPIPRGGRAGTHRDRVPMQGWRPPGRWR